ncbi:hypothetical protein TSA66_22275 [Noviherbaspirillum autotrophicum]|uniref:Uncharacterized protein n=2 Tax=Noviherbaspirillum autotrophicum TaxID=709839 RepID=A0A0C2BY39_9BURK|nr:hypothetical protein TSA66_22275 [Noviherbaspirillum autotrophicum]
MVACVRVEGQWRGVRTTVNPTPITFEFAYSAVRNNGCVKLREIDRNLALDIDGKTRFFLTVHDYQT